MLGVFCMANYDMEFNLKAFKYFLKGRLGYKLLAKKYGLPIVVFMTKYETRGNIINHKKV